MLYSLQVDSWSRRRWLAVLISAEETKSGCGALVGHPPSP